MCCTEGISTLLSTGSASTLKMVVKRQQPSPYTSGEHKAVLKCDFLHLLSLPQRSCRKVLPSRCMRRVRRAGPSSSLLLSRKLQPRAPKRPATTASSPPRFVCLFTRVRWLKTTWAVTLNLNFAFTRPQRRMKLPA